MRTAFMRSFFCLLLLLPGQSAKAGTQYVVGMKKGCGASITINAAFDLQPYAGYAPVTVEIANNTERPRSWGIHSQSRGAYQGNGVTSQQTLTVPANSSRSFDLIFPIHPASTDGGYYGNIQLQIAGYGVEQSNYALSQTQRNGVGSASVFTVIGKQIATPRLGELIDELDKRTKSTTSKASLRAGGPSQFFGTDVKTEQLQSDWRSLAGVGLLILHEDEYNQLPPEKRGAIQDWVAQGGELVVCTRAGTDESTRPGFGTIVHKTYPEGIPNAGQLAELVLASQRAVGIQNQLAKDYQTGWAQLTDVGALGLNAVLLSCFMGGFALLIGPVNLFLFARAGRRHRLFWTTPLISIGASALLFGVITLQDGFGGSGNLATLVCLLPTEHKAVIQQEQVSKTGLLFSPGFTLQNAAFISPIVLTQKGGANMDQSDGYCSGDWFASRAIQAQYLASVEPSRARIDLLNAAEVREGKAEPLVVSSFAIPLEDFFYVDAKSQVWSAPKLRTGEPVQLKLFKAHRYVPVYQFLSSRSKAELKTLESRTDCFFASSSGPVPEMIPTHPSIAWKSRHTVYTGPVSTNAK